VSSSAFEGILDSMLGRIFGNKLRGVLTNIFIVLWGWYDLNNYTEKYFTILKYVLSHTVP